jgi:hypothetical protein
LLELREQSSGTTHGIGVASHALGAAVLALCHEPGTLQHGDVFLHGSKRHVIVRGQLADGRVGAHHSRQDVATRGIGERPEQLVQGVGRCVSMYNHLVVDISTSGRSKLTGTLESSPRDSLAGDSSATSTPTVTDVRVPGRDRSIVDGLSARDRV